MNIQDIKTYVKWLTVVSAFLFGTSIITNEGLPPQQPNGNYAHYLDPIGITTICYGYVPKSNEKVKKEYTQKECDILLYKTIEEYSVVLKGLPALPLSTTVGFLDFGYNAGIGAANKSTIKKKLILKDLDGASKAVLDWRFVSKKKITQSDKSKGKWVFKNDKYYYDCSQFNNGKPNKLCYGLYTRRLMEAELIKGTMTNPDDIEKFIKQYYWK